MSEPTLQQQLDAALYARLDRWVTEMDRSAKAMHDAGLPDVAIGNAELATDLRRACSRLSDQNALLQAAERERLPHMCRDGHLEIRHADGEHAPCPLCRQIDRADYAEAERDRLRGIIKDISRPITMQDVRLAVGEGKLNGADILAGVNAELRRRSALNTDGGT